MNMELIRLLAQRARIYKPHIEVEAAHIIMDNIPYETDRSYLQDFCAENGITFSVFQQYSVFPQADLRQQMSILADLLLLYSGILSDSAFFQAPLL